MALSLKAGMYKGRVVKRPDGEWAQYGESVNGHPELILDLDLKIDDQGGTQRVSTPLYFSTDASEYSIARLRACGWKTNELDNLEGVGDNEVDVEVRHEPWTNPETGQNEMTTKVQIVSGGGRFNTAKPVDKKAFAARVGAITGVPTSMLGAEPPKPKF